MRKRRSGSSEFMMIEYKKMRLRNIVSTRRDKNRIEIVLEFAGGGRYDIRTIWLEDILGETPEEVADGLCKMADLLRSGYVTGQP